MASKRVRCRLRGWDMGCHAMLGALAAPYAAAAGGWRLGAGGAGRGIEEGVGWSLACGFSEFRLPALESKSIEVYPLEGDTLYFKKNN